MDLFIINTQIVLPNLPGHRFHVCSGQLALGVLHQVHQVAGPAAEVNVGLGIVVVIGNVDCTEHMGELCALPIGKRKPADTAESLSRCSVCLILLCHIRGKRSVLRTGQDRPTVGVVFLNACADVIDYETYSIITGFRCVSISVTFQHFQADKKVLIRCYGCGLRRIRQNGRFLTCLSIDGFRTRFLCPRSQCCHRHHSQEHRDNQEHGNPSSQFPFSHGKSSHLL